MGKIIAILCGALILIIGGAGAYFWLQPKRSIIGETSGSRAMVTYPKDTPFEDRYEEGELLVTNPPEGFEVGALELGFKVIEPCLSG